MEEGVSVYSVGPTSLRFGPPPARVGLLAGCTPGTMSRRQEDLGEMGFFSRACCLEMSLPRVERDEIMRRMNTGDARDLEPVDVPIPEQGRALVEWNQQVGEHVQAYVRRHWPENDLRTFKR